MLYDQKVPLSLLIQNFSLLSYGRAVDKYSRSLRSIILIPCFVEKKYLFFFNP